MVLYRLDRRHRLSLRPSQRKEREGKSHHLAHLCFPSPAALPGKNVPNGTCSFFKRREGRSSPHAASLRRSAALRTGHSWDFASGRGPANRKIREYIHWVPEGEGDTGKRVISRNEFCRIRAGGGRGMHAGKRSGPPNRRGRGGFHFHPKFFSSRARESSFSVSGITRYICMGGPERERRVFKEREGGIIHVCRDRSPSSRSVGRMVCWLPPPSCLQTASTISGVFDACM